MFFHRGTFQKKEYNTGVMREKQQRVKGKQIEVKDRVRKSLRIRYAGAENTEPEGVAEERRYLELFPCYYTVPYPCNADSSAGQTVFYSCKSRHKKVLGLKAVQAVAQLFIKQRNVS